VQVITPTLLTVMVALLWPMAPPAVVRQFRPATVPDQVRAKVAPVEVEQPVIGIPTPPVVR
jgi:hypothetical protein